MHESQAASSMNRGLLSPGETQQTCRSKAPALPHVLPSPNDNNTDDDKYIMYQPGLGACGASLSSSGRVFLSDLIGVGDRQMVHVRQDHIVSLPVPLVQVDEASMS